MLRLAHISDIHISAARFDWRRADWFNRRFASWINVRLLGRGHRFRDAENVLACLMREVTERKADHVVFSGDATALGFDSEFQRAAELTQVGRVPGLAVPGNHDYATIPSAASGLFEKHFAPWQQGLRVDDQCYPFAQHVGGVWLIGVNSCTGNRSPWDASGAVGEPALARLATLLAQLPATGLRILVTHYPICLSNGDNETRVHGLRDCAHVIEVAAKGGIALWLHGHRHHAYHLDHPPQAPFPVICAGSSTQTGLWSYGEYVIDGSLLQATRRGYDLKENRFHDVESFTMRLR